MARLILDGLSKTYPPSGKTPGKVAVHPARLEIQAGEFLVLVGPSGCGKTTLLRMIAGLEEVSSGSIQIDGREVRGVEPHERDIAMVFQNYALYPHMSVFENMSFGLKLRGVPKEEVRSRVESAAQTLGLLQPDNLLERKPKQLSGGQRQRVALGRAMVRQPKIFLFDEPLSNLDAKMRVEMRAEICRLHRKIGATMIYVTHDQVEAMTMADRIVVMNQGQIQQVGTPQEIYQKPANVFVGQFIGTPPMNILRGSIQQKGRGWEFQETTGAEGISPFRLNFPAGLQNSLESLPVQEAVLGFRPEAVHLEECAGDGCFDALVDLAENSGAESTLYLRTSQQRWGVRIPRIWDKSREGQTCRFYLNPSDLLFFDSKTGKLLEKTQAR